MYDVLMLFHLVFFNYLHLSKFSLLLLLLIIILLHLVLLIHVLRIRRHIFIAIIFICHITGVATVCSIINCVLLVADIPTNLHWWWIICGVLTKTIIQHYHATASTHSGFAYGRYTSDFLLRMYRLIRAVMFHFIIVTSLAKTTRTLTWYYHLLLHTAWWSYTIAL